MAKNKANNRSATEKRLRIAYPQDRIELYHIIDENGYYVTTEEYRRRIRFS